MLPIQAQGVQPNDKQRAFYPSAAEPQNPWHSNPPQAARKTMGVDGGVINSNSNKHRGMMVHAAQRQPFEVQAQVPQTPTHQHHRLSISSSTRSMENTNEGEAGIVPPPPPRRTSSVMAMHSVRHHHHQQQQQQPVPVNHGGWMSGTTGAVAANANPRAVRKPVQHREYISCRSTYADVNLPPCNNQRSCLQPYINRVDSSLLHPSSIERGR
jgi:hypothetical protein